MNKTYLCFYPILAFLAGGSVFASKIVGTDDRRPVKANSQIGRLVIGDRSCVGTHIAPRVVMTTANCVVEYRNGFGRVVDEPISYEVPVEKSKGKVSWIRANVIYVTWGIRYEGGVRDNWALLRLDQVMPGDGGARMTQGEIRGQGLFTVEVSSKGKYLGNIQPCRTLGKVSEDNLLEMDCDSGMLGAPVTVLSGRSKKERVVGLIVGHYAEKGRGNLMIPVANIWSFVEEMGGAF